jgi:5'-nucleotidase
MRLLQYKIAVLALAFVMGLSSSSYAQKLVILHTNDSHSQITPQTAGNKKGWGGYERRENYINQVRAENENVLLLDAGDFSQGSPYFTIFKGKVEVELLNALKYDAVCPGNHEFDNGKDQLAEILQDAEFDVVCANLNFEGTSLEKIVKPYTIIEKCGKKIGIIGATVNLRGLVNPRNVEGVKWEHPYKIINNIALKLKNEEKCDLIILLSHIGYDHGKEQNPSDDMIAKNSENIDIIIGGHSHTYIKEMAVYKNKLGRDVVVVTANEKGNYVGRLDIEF